MVQRVKIKQLRCLLDVLSLPIIIMEHRGRPTKRVFAFLFFFFLITPLVSLFVVAAFARPSLRFSPFSPRVSPDLARVRRSRAGIYSRLRKNSSTRTTTGGFAGDDTIDGGGGGQLIDKKRRSRTINNEQNENDYRRS